MVAKALNIIAKYFSQFSSKEGMLKLIISMLGMILAFKLNAGYVHPHNNYEFALLLFSGLTPFFLITMFPKLRYSIPLSLISVVLFFVLFKNIAGNLG